MLPPDARRVVREAFRERRYVVREELIARATARALGEREIAVFHELPEGRLDEIEVLRCLMGADHRRAVAGA
jgi:hypothetical protein